jgi:hypothetical protein
VVGIPFVERLNMSLETLVLLALFIMLPLIQQVIRATRQRNQRLPEPAERRPSGTLGTLPPELAVPPLPDTQPQARSDAMPASVLAPSRHGGELLTIALRPHRTIEQPPAAGVRTRRDLRRAIVLVATLGPSRANSPYDWPDQAMRA